MIHPLLQHMGANELRKIIKDAAGLIAQRETPQSARDELIAAAAGFGDDVSMRLIAERVAAAYGVTLSDLRSRSTDREIKAARGQAYADIMATGLYSYPRVGRFFGRDHTTIVKVIQNRARRQRKAAA